MEINLDKLAIEKAVTEAIVQSAIGDKIKVAVNDALGRNYDNPINTALSKVIADVAMKVVREDYEVKIREAVKAKLTETTVDEFVSRFWDSVLKRS